MNECDLHSTSEKVARVLLMRIIGLCFTISAELLETRTANRKPACQNATLSRHPLDLSGIYMQRCKSSYSRDWTKSNVQSNGYQKRGTVRLERPWKIKGKLGAFVMWLLYTEVVTVSAVMLRWRANKYYFFSLGLSIEFGSTYLSKSSSLNAFSSIALSFKVKPFLWAFFATLEAAS